MIWEVDHAVTRRGGRGQDGYRGVISLTISHILAQRCSGRSIPSYLHGPLLVLERGRKWRSNVSDTTVFYFHTFIVHGFHLSVILPRSRGGCAGTAETYKASQPKTLQPSHGRGLLLGSHHF